MRRFQQRESNATKRDDALFIGNVLAQNLVTDQDAPSLRVTAVTFQNGARNKWHTHTSEQVLIVTHGVGIVANSEEELTIEPGDVVLINPNENHWHGARQGESMTHLAILLPGEMRISDESPSPGKS